MKTLLENFNRFTEGRFTGGSVDIDPMSDEEQTAATKAYYDLRSFLEDDGTWVDAETGRSPAALPGGKPSDKLRSALRWIAKFEQGPRPPAGPPPSDEPPMSGPMLADKPRDDEQF